MRKPIIATIRKRRRNAYALLAMRCKHLKRGECRECRVEEAKLRSVNEVRDRE